jgi:hypothetical protein
MPRCRHAATSVRSAAFEQMAVAVLGHPAGTREVAFPGTTRTLRFSRGINVQNDSCDVLPIRSVSFGVEQAKVRNRMSLVVRIAVWTGVTRDTRATTDLRVNLFDHLVGQRQRRPVAPPSAPANASQSAAFRAACGRHCGPSGRRPGWRSSRSEARSADGAMFAPSLTDAGAGATAMPLLCRSS